jgi:hypothetical protein
VAGGYCWRKGTKREADSRLREGGRSEHKINVRTRKGRQRRGEREAVIRVGRQRERRRVREVGREIGKREENVKPARKSQPFMVGASGVRATTGRFTAKKEALSRRGDT